MVIPLIELAQVTGSILFLVNFLIAFLKFRKYTPRSIYFFELGMLLFSGWSFFHFLSNVIHSVLLFIVASILGFLALQMLLFFICSLDSTRIINTRTVLGLMLLTSLLSSFFHTDFHVAQVIMSSGDYVFLVKNPAYYALEAFFIGYVFLIYTIITFKVAIINKETQHKYYAWLQFIAVVMTTSIVAFVELIYVKLKFQTLLLDMYALTFYAPLVYTLVTTLTLVADIGLYTAFLYKISRLIVFEEGGIPLFAFDFHENVKHRDELLAGMISAVITAVSEVTESSKYVRQVILEDKVILVKYKQKLFFALVADKATKMINDSFSLFVDLFFTSYMKFSETAGTKQKIGAYPREEAIKLIHKAFPYIVPPKNILIKKINNHN